MKTKVETKKRKRIVAIKPLVYSTRWYNDVEKKLITKDNKVV